MRQICHLQNGKRKGEGNIKPKREAEDGWDRAYRMGEGITIENVRGASAESVGQDLG